MPEYAKVIVMGSPISKSNFKMHNKSGRSILPGNSGTYHDRYYQYEETIATNARLQNPGVVFKESLIAVLRVYYKSEKRHPDTNNITKSIFDGIEKSGLIINDAQVRRIIIEEYYDKVEPRFELELFAESVFRMSYEIRRHHEAEEPILYNPPVNHGNSLKRSGALKTSDLQIIQDATKKRVARDARQKKSQNESKPGETSALGKCNLCKKPLKAGSFVKADGGKTLICKSCFKKLF